MPRSRFPRPRARSVWWALGTGVIAVVVVVAAVLVPLIGLIGAASGAVWFARVPFGTIGLVVAAGLLLSAGLLASILRTRRGAPAWVLAVAATVAALVVSVYPAVAVAIAGTGQVGEIVPFITDLVRDAFP